MRQEKINSSTFEGLYLLEIQKLLTLDNLNTQKIEPHRKSEDISEIKVPSLTPSVQNSHLIARTLLVSNIFYFFLIIALCLFKRVIESEV